MRRDSSMISILSSGSGEKGGVEVEHSVGGEQKWAGMGQGGKWCRHGLQMIGN